MSGLTFRQRADALMLHMVHIYIWVVAAVIFIGLTLPTTPAQAIAAGILSTYSFWVWKQIRLWVALTRAAVLEEKK